MEVDHFNSLVSRLKSALASYCSKSEIKLNVVYVNEIPQVIFTDDYDTPELTQAVNAMMEARDTRDPSAVDVNSIPIRMFMHQDGGWIRMVRHKNRDTERAFKALIAQLFIDHMVIWNTLMAVRPLKERLLKARVLVRSDGYLIFSKARHASIWKANHPDEKVEDKQLQTLLGYKGSDETYQIMDLHRILHCAATHTMCA
jgi:hypothetical protein